MARFAAERAGRRHVVALRKIVQQMRDAEDDTAELARKALDFWTEVVAATNNLAFTLAFDSLALSYGSVLEHLHHLLAVELRAVDEYDVLVDAIAARKGYAAAERAAGIVAYGTAAIERLVEALDAGQAPQSRRRPRS
jgi:DNA-binding FadR family transcriptional regulator